MWIWDPVGGSDFRHPGQLPVEEEAAKAFFVEKLFGPRRCRLSKATVVDRKGGVTMVRREDGSNQEVPVSRVLHWYEGGSLKGWKKCGRPFGASRSRGVEVLDISYVYIYRHISIYLSMYI